MDTRKKYVAEIARWRSLGENYTDAITNVGPANVPGLTELQSSFAKKIIDLVGQYGQFDKDDCQYEQKSDMLAEGIACLHCVFYQGGGDCSIVKDQVDPMGVCRFNTVPEDESAPSDSTTLPDVP